MGGGGGGGGGLEWRDQAITSIVLNNGLLF